MGQDDQAVPKDRVVVGVVADPGGPQSIARSLAHDLPATLAEKVSSEVEWEVRVSHDALALDADDRVSLGTVARERMPVEGWDLMVCLTDLPRIEAGIPVVADVDTTHGAAVASLPAIGWLRRGRQVRDLVLSIVELMVQGTLKLHTRTHEPLLLNQHPAEMLWRRQSGGDEVDVHLVMPGTRGWLRLLFGMVRDNRPWRLVPSLSTALAAASATAALGVFFSNIWTLAVSLTAGRLLLISVFAVTVMVLWLLVHNQLWEQFSARHSRREAMLYNLSTVLTLLIGVTCMYVLLLAGTLVVSIAVISPDFLSAQTGTPADLVNYGALAWLAGSMGTIAGALGSSLESEHAVRRATYSRRERERRELHRQREQQE